MLWHREVYWRPEFEQDIAEFFTHEHQVLHFTKHATARLGERNLRYPDLLQIQKGYIFEIEKRDGKMYKIVSRFPSDGEYDMIVALMKDTNGYVVKSVWACRCEDKHSTLDTSLYEKGDGDAQE